MAVLVTVVAAAGSVSAVTTAEAAPTAASGVLSGLTVSTVLPKLPSFSTTFSFAEDGSIYVAAKEGAVYRYASAGATSPTQVLDLRREVYDYGDHGLLGMALDPAFGTGKPYLYVLYTRDRDPFGTDAEPRWASGGQYDACPNPPGADGCTITASLVRFTVGADGVADPASALTLLDGADEGRWCFQYTSHGVGSVLFGPDGALYVSAGDGAMFTGPDYGNGGGRVANTPTPFNPCNDAPAGRGTAEKPATTRGGALRSQAVRAASGGDRVSWDGSILRIDPSTGAAMPDNPLVDNGIDGDDRIVAYGLRNPYRLAFRPGTQELWLGDVGWSTAEEINSFTTGPGQEKVPNFGWPCREGTEVQSTYATLGIGLCESLAQNPVSTIGGVSSPLTDPVYAWKRPGAQPADGCNSTGGGAATGGVFVDNDSWPGTVASSYVFADFARRCIVAMPIGSDGRPDPSQRVALSTKAGSPVQLRIGPGGDVYYIDIIAGTLLRIRSTAANVPPEAVVTADPSYGPTPLAVRLDASGSTDANPGETLRYSWDLDGDGACDDGTGVSIEHVYADDGDATATVCVTDGVGAQARASTTIAVGESPPTISRLDASPVGAVAVGDVVTLTADAADAQDGALPESAFTWAVDIRHCPDESSSDDSVCHTHPYVVPASGRSAEVTFPDHDYYAYLQATLTVTDSHGLSSAKTIEIRPRVSTVTVDAPQGSVTASLGPASGSTPLTQKFLEGGAVEMSVPAQKSLWQVPLDFAGWFDDHNGAAMREVTAPAGETEYDARYASKDPFAAFLAWLRSLLSLRR
ncbi:PQQ-dependent sugar dehydrogenase [Microbacteriaceae bacterium VKM Ac-2854]|nr:PQQ-dependent sugar dehydrogenase [Microbacteriaceae bacterium VKM Ac-2854]